ncbi:hypothetical protein PGT21_029656 [Puccinia graminis f. sp. tritici]|uniref:Uncharacterized protein n=1 Tax=Puccinia graminis f. sp. tritici TaxID=56615 RepID=A0A5B0QBP7_PUCGR|nr:hypothetical protein PGT21_029656 [Puccinia graminis f. sp. tritici]
MRNQRTSFVDMSQVLPALGISSQNATWHSMERWRDALWTGSQSIDKTPRRSQSITLGPWRQPSNNQCQYSMPGSSSTDHKRTASIDTGASCSPAANRTED